MKSLLLTVVVAGSLLGTVSAAQADTNIGWSSSLHAHDAAVQRDSTAKRFADQLARMQAISSNSSAFQAPASDERRMMATTAPRGEAYRSGSGETAIAAPAS